MYSGQEECHVQKMHCVAAKICSAGNLIVSVILSAVPSFYQCQVFTAFTPKISYMCVYLVFIFFFVDTEYFEFFNNRGLILPSIKK